MASRRIEDMIPEMQEVYKLFEATCHAAGLDFIVTCTTRTKEEQTELVKKGFSKTMNSRHLTGEAFDIAVVKDGKLSWKNRDYEPYGDIGMSIGLVWGGNFKGFKDSVHFEYRHE